MHNNLLYQFNSTSVTMLTVITITLPLSQLKGWRESVQGWIRDSGVPVVSVWMLLHCVMGRGTAAMERMRTEHCACSEELLVSSETETLPLSMCILMK